ncbi:selenium metabolism-associated LysR family transcriptional regulator [Gottschalkiaceae bacterium SANA]|nr:selenium metabolism-associated LysR family transcriptional regulator [Gottschalkiaceae bacterium SANA]
MIDDKLHTFLCVAQTMNFSKAAELLHITQPAVSQHIKALESQYRVSLFNDRRKNMKLSEEGELLLVYATEMNRLQQSLAVKMQTIQERNRVYRVGATMTIGGYVLPKILGKHKLSHPQIDIQLSVDNTETVIEQMIRGDLILGMVEGPFPQERFTSALYRKDELVVAVSPEHPFASKKEEVSLEQLMVEPLILREQGSGTRLVFEKAIAEAGYAIEDANVHMEIGNIHALVSLVESNLGVTVISRDAIADSLKSETLCEVSLSGMQIFREYRFIYLDDRIAFIQDFIAYCKKEYKNSL